MSGSLPRKAARGGPGPAPPAQRLPDPVHHGATASRSSTWTRPPRASSRRPSLSAVDAYNREYSVNIHRGIYELAERATAAYEGARAKVARLINAPSASEIVFVRNATEAINLVAYSWGRRNIGRSDTIVLTEMEHHANLVPWQLLVQEKDGDLEFVPVAEDGTLRLEVYEVLLHLRPKLVAFTHCLQRAGHDQPGPRDDRHGPCRGRAGADRRRPGGAAPAGRRPGARAPTSTSSPATRCWGPPAPGRSGRGASCSRRCRPSWPAAT